MKVIHVGKFYPPERGGMEGHLQMLCEGLHGRNYAVEVVAANRRSRRSVVEDVSGVRIRRFGTWFEIAGTSCSPFMIWYLWRRQAEIFHVHLPNPFAVVAYFLCRPRGTLVVTYHSDVIRQKVLSRLFEPLLQRFLRRAGAVIVTTRQYAETSSSLRDVMEKVKVIPLGVDIQRCANDAERFAVSAEEINRNYGPRLIVALGRLVYYKGFDVLIRAMKGLDANLLIVGEGPLRDELIDLARRCGCSDRVRMVGDVDNVAPYLMAARVFAFPSVVRTEAFGIAQLEAMAFGVPVVNTALDSGVPFVSVDRISGITVAPSDVVGLAKALKILLEDDRLWSELASGGRRRAREQFSSVLMIEAVGVVYEGFRMDNGDE